VTTTTDATSSIASAHPGEPLLTEREYWRMRHDAIETNPNPRCC
jgi:uncharacterized short protein YbdD (DUF466 family)